jgi:toxin HigB-1
MEKLRIEISKTAQKQLRKTPKEIDRLEKVGYRKTREIKGLHDEPLKGIRKGQRSIRLNKAYRAIYVLNNDGSFKILEVLEVSKHKY